MAMTHISIRGIAMAKHLLSCLNSVNFAKVNIERSASLTKWRITMWVLAFQKNWGEAVNSKTLHSYQASTRETRTVDCWLGNETERKKEKGDKYIVWMREITCVVYQKEIEQTVNFWMVHSIGIFKNSLLSDFKGWSTPGLRALISRSFFSSAA